DLPRGSTRADPGTCRTPRRRTATAIRCRSSGPTTGRGRAARSAPCRNADAFSDALESPDVVENLPGSKTRAIGPVAGELGDIGVEPDRIEQVDAVDDVRRGHQKRSTWALTRRGT